MMSSENNKPPIKRRKKMKNLMKKIAIMIMTVTVLATSTLVTAIPAMAATNPTITVKAVSDITSSDAQLNATISNPSKVKINKVGFVLYDANNKQIAQKYDNYNKNTASFKAWFNLNKYYGTLKADTTYKYAFFITTANGTITTSIKSFKTEKAVALSTKVANFVKDSRWKNGISWPQRSPKLSKWSSKGCCAYAADFCKYVYGYNWATSSSRFKKYTSVNNIKTGDIIHTKGHWFVVLSRVGNKLYTAEGSYDSKTRVSTTKPGYYIENGKLYMSWYNSNKTTLKYKAMTFQYGYHFN